MANRTLERLKDSLARQIRKIINSKILVDHGVEVAETEAGAVEARIIIITINFLPSLLKLASRRLNKVTFEVPVSQVEVPAFQAEALLKIPGVAEGAE